MALKDDLDGTARQETARRDERDRAEAWKNRSQPSAQ